MSDKHTPEQIAAALRCCSDSNSELSCAACPFCVGDACHWNDGYDMAAALIESQAARIRELENLVKPAEPTVDAVQVVRCRDCVYYRANSTCEAESEERYPFAYQGDDFCSFGKRKDD